MTTTRAGLQSFLRSSRSALLNVGGNAAILSDSAQKIHVVLGNEAADADSIVSSLCCAYLKQKYHLSPGAASSVFVPMCCIPRSDLVLRRDVSVLFEMAGLSIDDLICLEDCALDTLATEGRLSLTLTDHNKLAEKWGHDESTLNALDTAVCHIVDHHFDKGAHAHVQGDSRNIAYDSSEGKEVTGSTCTLVAEAFFEMLEQNGDMKDTNDHAIGIDIQGDIATLLAGVILLDTSNMSEAVGKGRPRDASALDKLLPLLPPSIPDRSCFFTQLRDAKTSPMFWNSLSAADCIRLDYKQFSVKKNNDNEVVQLGMSSVFISSATFLTKQDAINSIISLQARIDLLVLMCMIVPEDGGIPRREILAAGPASRLDSLDLYLQSDVRACQADAQRIGERVDLGDMGCGWVVDIYVQGNIKMSRKQIAPILEIFLNK